MTVWPTASRGGHFCEGARRDTARTTRTCKRCLLIEQRPGANSMGAETIPEASSTSPVSPTNPCLSSTALPSPAAASRRSPAATYATTGVRAVAVCR